MNRRIRLSALAGTLALLASCSATSGTAIVVPSTTSSPSTSSADLSAPGTTSALTSSNSSDESSTTRSEDSSSGGSSSSSTSDSSTKSEDSSTSSESVSSTGTTPAIRFLDAPSVSWLTTYCTSVAPMHGLIALNAQLTAAKNDLPKAKIVLVKEFQTAGQILTSTATKLKGVPAPSLTRVGSDLPGLLSKFSTLGATLTTDGKKIAAIDPVNDPGAFGRAILTYAPDLSKLSTVLGTKAGLKLPIIALDEVKKIPSCRGVLTTG